MLRSNAAVINNLQNNNIITMKEREGSEENRGKSSGIDPSVLLRSIGGRHYTSPNESQDEARKRAISHDFQSESHKHTHGNLVNCCVSYLIFIAIYW
jgi:hypothetical protein